MTRFMVADGTWSRRQAAARAAKEDEKASVTGMANAVKAIRAVLGDARKAERVESDLFLAAGVSEEFRANVLARVTSGVRK